MSQHDFEIANQGFPAFRSDLNDGLQALASNSAGTSEPTTTYAYQFWYDTTNDLLKMRNTDDDAWIELAYFDQTNDEWEVRSAVIQAVDSAGVVIKTDDGTTRIEVQDDGDVSIDSGTLFVDASENRVGIGTTTPSTELDVDGDITADGIYLGGTTSANFLDDYEEGTWTPTLEGVSSTSGQSYSRQEGKYIKVGNLVFVSFDVILTTEGTLSGDAVLSGLPFTTPDEFANRSGAGVGYYTSLGNVVNDLGLYVEKNSNYAYITASFSESVSKSLVSSSTIFADGTHIISAFCYQI